MLGKTRVARVLVPVLDVVHALDKKLLGDAQGVTELKGVQVAFLFVHNNHDVVSRLIVNQQLAVAVIDDATRRVLHFLEKSVTIGIALVVIAQQLKRKEPHDVHQYHRNGHPGYDKTTFL